MPYKSKKRQKQYQKKWYQKSGIERRLCMRQFTKQNKAKVLCWYHSFKATLKCSRCSETHLACLDFHHRNPKYKRFAIGLAAASGICIRELLKEIAKCDVLCANCHRKEEYEKRLK